MQGIKPCPYCGGEVEVVRVKNVKGQKTYRIECRRCRQLVAKGTKFPVETEAQGAERIKEYEAYLAAIFSK